MKRSLPASRARYRDVTGVAGATGSAITKDGPPQRTGGNSREVIQQ